MSAATEWLLGRVSSSPPDLVEVMLASLVDTSDQSIPETLAEGALSLYATVLRSTGGREDALALLAADALFTHAFQAQAELDPENLAAYVDGWTDGTRLAAILDTPATAPE